MNFFPWATENEYNEKKNKDEEEKKVKINNIDGDARPKKKIQKYINKESYFTRIIH